MTEARQGQLATDRGRFVLMDSMRAVAALSVLVFHATYSYPASPTGVWAYLSQRNAGPPITGVVLFFLISGFVLYRPFVRAHLSGEPMPRIVPYAIRRAARIVPAYWVALAILTIWLGWSEVESVKGIVRYFGFLQLYGSLSTASGGISPAWTLDVEVTFYIALPLLAIAVRRLTRPGFELRGEIALCVTLVLVSLAWQALIFATVPDSNGSKILMLWSLPGSLDLFAAGMALAVASVAVERMPREPSWVGVVERRAWLPWLGGLAVLFAVGWIGENLSSDGFAAWYIPSHELKALGCLLLLLPVVFGGTHQGALRRALGWRPLLWLGAVSYGIYLWHYPLIKQLAPHLARHGELLFTLACAAITVAIATLSYQLVELPAQRFARRFSARRGAAREHLPPVLTTTGAVADEVAP